MSQAPSTSDKPVFYFALFPFISKLVIIPHLAMHCAAFRAEAGRGRLLCRAALNQSLLPAGCKDPVGRYRGMGPAHHAVCRAVLPFLHTRAAFPLISHSGGDGFSPCEPDVLHGA